MENLGAGGGPGEGFPKEYEVGDVDVVFSGEEGGLLPPLPDARGAEAMDEDELRL